MTDRGKIMGTRDGSTWAELSTVSSTTTGIWFSSPESGVEFDSPDSTTQSTLRRSNDGGKTWQPVSRCGLEATVAGLPRKLGCIMSAAQFVSPTIGYAGGSAGDVAVFGKTLDAGQTWTMSLIPETRWGITDLRFWTEKDGIAVLTKGEEVYWTANGGESWTRSVKTRLWPSFFGAAEGKIIVSIGYGGGIGYSFNGGRTFTSRPLDLPAQVTAVTFPDAQHGYVVGHNAMVYRYRIVPVEYTSQGMLAAMAP
jgi:photosystem II stability/assembly factor-like uncharacterized protein